MKYNFYKGYILYFNKKDKQGDIFLSKSIINKEIIKYEKNLKDLTF